MKFFLLFLCSLFCFISCNVYDSEINEIKKLQQTLKEIKIQIDKAEIAEFFAKRDSINEYFDGLKENFISDSMDTKFTYDVNALKYARRYFKKIGSKTNEIENDILSAEKSLLDLSKDIKNGNLEKSKVKEFLDFEKNKVRTIEKNFASHKEQLSIHIETYKRVTPLLKKYLNEK